MIRRCNRMIQTCDRLIQECNKMRQQDPASRYAAAENEPLAFSGLTKLAERLAFPTTAGNLLAIPPATRGGLLVNAAAPDGQAAFRRLTKGQTSRLRPGEPGV